MSTSWHDCDEIMLGVDYLKAHFHARDNTLPKLPFSSGPSHTVSTGSVSHDAADAAIISSVPAARLLQNGWVRTYNAQSLMPFYRTECELCCHGYCYDRQSSTELQHDGGARVHPAPLLRKEV